MSNENYTVHATQFSPSVVASLSVTVVTLNAFIVLVTPTDEYVMVVKRNKHFLFNSILTGNYWCGFSHSRTF